MKTMLFRLLACCLFAGVTDVSMAQHAPGMGYIFPTGGQAGQTTDVILGGYDWTPDMQIFVHDPRITLELTGPPGPVIVPEPPYWFGRKARRPPFPQPREVTARLTIPADVTPGLIKWQAANANGATNSGTFVVTDARGAIVVEMDGRTSPQKIDSLPCCISGQIKLVQEVDQYLLTASTDGPVTCITKSRAIGSPLNAVVEIRDSSDRLFAEAADTSGIDTALTFLASGGESYTVSVYDVDFRGDRSFVYQLDITAGPRVVTAIPAVGLRGETRSVEFIGYGITTGEAKLESLFRDVTFSTAESANSFLYSLSTAHGNCPSFPMHVSNHPQSVDESSPLIVPGGVTGVLDERFGEDTYSITGKKDDVWWIEASGERTGSLIDVAVEVLDSDGKLLAGNDDRSDSTDAELEFKVPADGDYQIVVSDVASQSGTRAATYHLSVQQAHPDFLITAAPTGNTPIGGKANVALKAIRRGGFVDAIDVSMTGLPPGVTMPSPLQVPANQSALNVELSVAADAPASASLVEFVGSAMLGEQLVTRRAGPTLIATTIKPPFSIDAEGKDDVTKWPRGSTFPAPVLIERDEGFSGEITLEMASMQGRHQQGISGPELLVPPDVTRILYPVYLPEWLETTRTSRMVVNGVAQVVDPQGNTRYSVSLQKTRMGFLPTGAMMKLSASDKVFSAKPGEQIRIPITIDQSGALAEVVRVELVCADSISRDVISAEPLTLTSDIINTEFLVTVSTSATTTSELLLKLRATLLKGGTLPVISEFDVVVVVGDSDASGAILP